MWNCLLAGVLTAFVRRDQISLHNRRAFLLCSALVELPLVCPKARVYSAARERDERLNSYLSQHIEVEKILWHRVPRPTKNLLKTVILP